MALPIDPATAVNAVAGLSGVAGDAGSDANARAKDLIAFFLGALTDAQVTAAIGHFKANRAALDNEQWKSFLGF